MQTRIMQAAQILVKETAVAFTMDDLAAHTGLSRATIYRQVGGKKKILQRLATEHGLGELEQPDVPSRILQAARTLFGKFGLSAPTMEQVAAEAGVGVATIYRHFGDKPTLLRTFLQTYQPNLPTNTEDLSGNVTADLTQLVQTMIQFIIQNQDMVRLSFANQHEWLSELSAVRPFHERSLSRVASFLQNQIDTGQLRPIDPEQAATALLGMILSFSLIMPTYYNFDDPAPQETAEFITQLFLQGVQEPI